jgi:hypothetical protein
MGRGPEPLDFVLLEYQTWEGRYDDPDHTWRTLYLARDAYGAWVEVLARFRPHDDLAAALEEIISEEWDPAPIPGGQVPLSWLSNRRVAATSGKVCEPDHWYTTPRRPVAPETPSSGRARTRRLNRCVAGGG